MKAKTRDAGFKEMRERLEKERADALAELKRLKEYLQTEMAINVEEGGFELHEREKQLALARNLEHKLASIKHSLHLMEEGKYGICEECGKPISIQRLRALPNTTLCLSCGRKREKSRR